MCVFVVVRAFLKTRRIIADGCCAKCYLTIDVNIVIYILLLLSYLFLITDSIFCRSVAPYLAESRPIA